MGKDQRFGITRNFAKHLIRGGVKSIPLAGNLFDEIIFGTLEGETAQKESKKLHAKLDEIVKQIDTQEGDFAEILAGLHLQADFNEEVRKEFAKIEQLLRDPENAPVPESFNSAFEKLAADHDWQDEKLNRIDAKVTAIFDKMLDEAGSGSGRRRKRIVRIVIPNIEFNDFDERNKTLLEHGLAQFLRIEPGDISVTEVEPGSVKVTVEIPDDNFRKLVKAIFKGVEELAEKVAPLNLKMRVFISYSHKDQMKAKGFNLLSWAKNVDVDFVGRHLLDPVDSTNKQYIDSKIREQIKGSSVTVVLIGKDTKKSKYQPFEIEQSLAKDSPNGILGIKLDKSIKLPKDSAVGQLLHDAGAEVIDWDLKKFADAIERAALSARRASKIKRTPPGGSGCIR